jgi:hypothetical protein
MAYEVQQIPVDKARWEPPRARIVDNTLEKSKLFFAGICNNSIQESFVELASKELIGDYTMVGEPGEYDRIIGMYNAVYQKKLNELSGEPDRIKRQKIAEARTWEDLVQEAKKCFRKFTKAPGNEVVLAVIRERSHDLKGNDTILVDGQDAANPFRPQEKDPSIRPPNSPTNNE